MSTIASTSDPAVADVGRFLLRYSAWLLGSGATCIRLEKNISRIAATYGMHTETVITPRHIQLSVSVYGSDASFSQLVAVQPTCINFSLNTALSRLSWEISDRRLSVDEASARFDDIIAAPGGDIPLLAVAVAVANASFCRLFGGDYIAMAIVFAATLAGYCVKQLLAERHTDPRVIFLACSFVSAVLASADGLFHLGSTPDIALGTSVLYLVPGIPFLNSFSDLLYRHYICAFSRFTDAAVLTCCLSAGLCAGMLIMHQGGWLC